MLKKRLFKFFLLIFLVWAAIYFYNRDILNTSQPNYSPKIVAHRGASAIAPENTFPAIEKAVEIGVDGIEIDVHMTKDGQIVLIHDSDVSRTTDGVGEIKDLTMQELEDLDAGSWKGEVFKGTKIPTLAEVLSYLKGKCTLFLEVKKGKDGRYAGLEEEVIRLLNLYQMKEQTIIMSFQSETLKKFYELDPGLRLHKLLIGELIPHILYHDGSFQWGDVNQLYFASSTNLNHHFLNPRMLLRSARAEKTNFIYTINEETDMMKAMELGVDGIITNYPSRLKQLIEISSNQ
ncbi:MAG: glycerophosphodiester phosphodiesterase family protein [Bacteroidota bacterium]